MAFPEVLKSLPVRTDKRRLIFFSFLFFQDTTEALRNLQGKAYKCQALAS